MTRPLKQTLVILVSWIFVAHASARNWTLSDGTQFQGEIERWGDEIERLGSKESPGDLTIKGNFVYSQTKQFFISQFSQSDQAYLQSLRIPWKKTEEMRDFALVGGDLVNLNTGAVVGPRWFQDNWLVRPIKNGMNDTFFAQNLHKKSETMGFAVPSLVRLFKPYLRPIDLLGQDALIQGLSTNTGVCISSNFKNAFFLRNGDVWVARPDWGKSELSDQRQLTSIGLFNNVKLLFWFDRWLYLWGEFSSTKPIVKLDLTNGATEEISPVGVFGSGSELFPNPSGDLVCAPREDILHIFDFRSGKESRMRNYPDGDTSHTVLVGSGHPMQWLDNDRFVVFTEIYNSGHTAKNRGFSAGLYVINARTRAIQNIEVGIFNNAELPTNTGYWLTSFESLVPGKRVACITQSPDRDSQNRMSATGAAIPVAYALVNFDTGKVTSLPFTSIDKFLWLSDQLCIYTRKTGGLNSVGTWLYDLKTNKSQRALTREAFLDAGEDEVNNTAAYFEDRGEIWFEILPAWGSIDLYRINLEKGEVDRMATFQVPAHIVRLDPTPIDLGIGTNQKSSFEVENAQAQAETGAKDQAQNPADGGHGHLEPEPSSPPIPVRTSVAPQGSSQSDTNETDADQAGQRVASNANQFSTSGRRNINPQHPQGASDSEEINTPSTSRILDSKAAIMAFVKEFWSHNASNDPSEWASDFANEAGYCYSNTQWADREFIRHDRAKLVDRYPVRHYEFRSPDIEMTGEGNTARVTFSFAYSYAGRKTAAGSGRVSLIVQNIGGRWLISDYREKIDRQ